MNDDDDDEFVEEEILIYLNLEPNLQSNEIDGDPKIKIIGIYDENPIIEINGKIFRGTYDFSVGTCVFLERDPDPPPSDPLYDKNPEIMYKCFAKTTKILNTKRIFVEKNSTDETNNDAIMENEPNLTIESDKISYEDALKSLELAEEKELNESRSNSVKIRKKMYIDSESD